ncbi:MULTISPECIES: urease accessory UreF family protein [unclassified Streptomyces]|uniref:urease accessory protein UreF n=1 Tax=unclassified Streptomyces TaxID=2593676 RepID=UPI002E15BC22|nr:urease accessory protein [Streptomyces sp. NBC_01197]WSS48750.1 urease accessory protein [Streptomyces sp. NBC_01180]
MTPAEPAAPGPHASLLVSLQLADPGFPGGGCNPAYEWDCMVRPDRVDRAGLGPLLHTLLRRAVGPTDATALALAHAAATEGCWGEVAEIDERLHAAKLGREERAAATRTGGRMLDLGRAVFPSEAVEEFAALVARREAPGNRAVVSAVIQAGVGVPRQQAVTAELFAFCAAFAGAARRTGAADHSATQLLLRGAAPVVEEVTAEALRRELADLGGCVPAAEALSGRPGRAPAQASAG